MNLMTTGFNAMPRLFKQASAYIRPVTGRMAIGGAVGAGASYAMSDQNTTRNTLLSGLAGAAGMGAWGMRYPQTFMRAGMTGGARAGMDAVKARMLRRAQYIGRTIR